METFVVRVWLPDRPGALGQVASAIGSIGGDVAGIEILERGGGSAIDELRVSLPSAALLDALIEAMRGVPGVAVEDVRPVDLDRPDGALAGLTAVAAIAATPVDLRLETACDLLRDLFDADWVVAVALDGGAALASAGEQPSLDWLGAFLLGSEHLDAQQSPGDLVWVRAPQFGVAIASGRSGRVFHARERDEFRIIGSIIDSLAPSLAGAAGLPRPW